MDEEDATSLRLSALSSLARGHPQHAHTLGTHRHGGTLALLDTVRHATGGSLIAAPPVRSGRRGHRWRSAHVLQPPLAAAAQGAWRAAVAGRLRQGGGGGGGPARGRGEAPARCCCRQARHRARQRDGCAVPALLLVWRRDDRPRPGGRPPKRKRHHHGHRLRGARAGRAAFFNRARAQRRRRAHTRPREEGLVWIAYRV
mmetsp:Transcript_49430/g.165014  ORF Transcript_49430/g.165014 Transcript_49430/m.165014 type:complete len:200 (+) Transcript_49430:1492-2091(+)